MTDRHREQLRQLRQVLGVRRGDHWDKIEAAAKFVLGVSSAFREVATIRG
jgi:hypothetical protein